MTDEKFFNQMCRFSMSRIFVTLCVLSSFCWASIPGWKSGEVSEELRKRLGQTKGSDPLIRPWDNPDLEYLLANDYRDYLASERAMASSKKPNKAETTKMAEVSETETTTESSLELTNEEISDSVIEEDDKGSSEDTKQESVVKTSENTDIKSGNFTTSNEDYDNLLKDLLTINSTTRDQKSTNQQVGEDDESPSASEEEATSPNVNETTPGIKTTLVPLSDLFSKAHTTGVQIQEGPLNAKDCLPVSYRLKGIRSLIPPELLYELAKCPIGGYVLFGSNDFPLEAIKPKQEKAILANGLSIKSLLKEVLKLLPLDVGSTSPLIGTRLDDESADPKLQDFLKVIESAENQQLNWTLVSTLEFLELSRKATIFIQTAEPGSVGSILLKKGPVRADLHPDQESKLLNQTVLNNLKELEILRDKLKQISVNKQ